MGMLVEIPSPYWICTQCGCAAYTKPQDGCMDMCGGTESVQLMGPAVLGILRQHKEELVIKYATKT